MKPAAVSEDVEPASSMSHHLVLVNLNRRACETVILEDPAGLILERIDGNPFSFRHSISSLTDD